MANLRLRGVSKKDWKLNRRRDNIKIEKAFTEYLKNQDTFQIYVDVYTAWIKKHITISILLQYVPHFHNYFTNFLSSTIQTVLYFLIWTIQLRANLSDSFKRFVYI